MKKNSLNLITSTALLSSLFASTSLMATGMGAGDILIIARVLNIEPDVGSNTITNMDGSQFATGGASINAGIDVDNAYSLGVDVTYMVTNNFGVELMLDTSSKHDIKGSGDLASVNIGDVTVIAPSLFALWHFTPNSNIRPYVGVGINYSLMFSESTTSQFTNTINAVVGPGVTSTDLSVDDAFGLAAQIGVDIDINQDWYVSFDAKYFDLDTDATVQVNAADAVKVDFDLNPLALGVGIGTTF